MFNDLNTTLTMLVTIICTIGGTGGVFAYLQKRADKKDVSKQMLLGIAHDRIIVLALTYINRKNRKISKDEFENIDKYLYKPYLKLGGNGTVTRLMEEVYELQICSSVPADLEEEANE